MKRSDDVTANNLLQLLKDLMRYWHIVAISLALSFLFAILYLQYSAKTYRVSSSVLLRLENNNNFAGRGGGAAEILSAFDFILQDKTLQNEIHFMQSLPLIRDVVGDLDIRTYYYTQNGLIPRRFKFSYENIYRDSPFMVIPTENHLQPVNVYFHINIIDEEKFEITASSDEAVIMNFDEERVVSNSAAFEIEGTYNFGSLISNELASFTVLLNSNFDPDRYINKNLFFKFNNLNWLASSFKNSLSISNKSLESTLVEISVRAENSGLGLEFLNALIQSYIDANLEEANFLASQTIEHIDRQLVDVSQDLTRSEEQLQNLRSSHSVLNIEEKAQNIYLQLENSRRLYDDTRRRLNHLEQLSEYFEEYKDSSRILAPSALGIPNPLLNNLIQELVNLNSEKQRIIHQDQTRNPRLQTIDISIENLKTAISDNIRFTKSNTQSELNDLETKIAHLNEEFASLPGTQRQLLGIERRFNLSDAIYTSLLERRIQAQIIKASKLPDAKIIEPPRHMGVASPNRVIVLFLALFAGMLLPSGAIMGIRLITNRISNKDDIKLITKLPVMGSIPVSQYSEQNVVKDYPRSPIAEAFHMLRTNLVYYLQGESNRTILVTSTAQGEGKSFSAINLATSFALANSKTVLVEFDLRNPNRFVDQAFNANELVGISSFLINKATYEEIIVPTEVPNLEIIQAGPVPPNPIELISNTRTHELFKRLKKEYDFIIIDTPPYGLVTDAFLLMNIADIKIYVSRIGYTKKKALAASMEDIEGKNIDDLYLLINDSYEDKLRYGRYAYAEKKKTKGPLMKKIEYWRKKIAVF